MLNEKLELINEQTSPLFRILSVYDPADPVKKSFTNNISAFHIGEGKILSVAHNLRSESGVVNAFEEKIWQSDIATRVDANHPVLREFQYNEKSDKRYLVNGGNTKVVSDTLKQINFDTRWITLYNKKICRPYLIIHFSGDTFYNDSKLDAFFTPSTKFHEPLLNRHTYILELELVNAFYGDDIAMYQIINTDQSIINKLPFIDVEFGILDSNTQLYCLQSAPGGPLGKLLNNATIEGFLDHHGIFQDRIGGAYVMEGLRYLIRGYFRFGSSGAPYVYQDGGAFKVVAIQSEASPIQLSINNSREGNFQYVNAIASPMHNVRKELVA